MCGLVAVFSEQPIPSRSIEDAMKQMFSRGPDGSGVWEGDRVMLGHRRLAIIDLDERAAQPMSMNNRYVIVFNGEIYNYQILKTELLKKGKTFITGSDTEVLLAMYQEYGVQMIPRLEGMFAFVIWDTLEEIGIAARDAYGIKPLYFGKFDGGLIFASQVKTILAANMVSTELDIEAQEQFWMLGSVPEPQTWFKNIRSLGAGQVAHISKNFKLDIKVWSEIGRYWRNSNEFTQTPLLKSPMELFRNFVKESIKRHLVTDIPIIGLFLSGGIDSGALAGLMVDELGKDKVTAITICFDEFRGEIADEAPVARQIAQYYGIKHHIRRVSKAEFLEDLPIILRAMDQPSIDGVNTWYACKAASEIGLKVVLSGVGGDELLLGYPSFRCLPRLVDNYRLLLRLPFIYRVAKLITLLFSRISNNTRWIYAPDWLKTIAGAWWLRRSLSSPMDLKNLMSYDNLHETTIKNFDPNNQVYKMVGSLPKLPELALAQIESMSYLRNQLLRDADWASMSHSVELRTPLVDEKLLRSIVPLMGQLKNFPGKTLLANAPNKPLPAFIAKRPKTGFGIPVQRWLSGEDLKISIKQDRWTWARKVTATYII